MARKNGLTAEDDPLSSSRAVRPNDVDRVASSATAADSEGAENAKDRFPLDARFDLEAEQESPFLRAQKRVPVRRGPLPSKKAAQRVKYGLMFAGILAGSALLVAGLNHYGRNSWRFRVDSSDQIEISGNHQVSRARVLQVFGADIARNVFSIPLDERKKQLEEIPWVESATLMRFLPNRVKVHIRERTPIAFVQLGSRIALIDASGVVMDIPMSDSISAQKWGSSEKRYSYPVIVGMKDTEPLSTRAARMKIFVALLRELDSGGTNYSRDVSEVDLSDPDDVRITVTDNGNEILIHLGAANFLERYKIFVAHLQEWRQQFQHLNSVDLRYERQVIVNPN